MRILLVENDPALGTFLQRGLIAEQYEADLTADANEARAFAARDEYSAAILDVDAFGSGGPVLLRCLRDVSRQLPIVVLSDRARIEERIQLLDLGADDLVAKPFAFSELSARLRALLRRGSRGPETVICVEDLELNRLEHTVKRGGRVIALTPKEFSLLEYLMRNVGRSVTRSMILEHVWNLTFDTTTNLVDVYINYVRRKIDDGHAVKLIRTVRGVGYELKAAAVEASVPEVHV